jgi:hypothetical protein
MHADESPDLRVVGKVLRDVFDVCNCSLNDSNLRHPSVIFSSNYLGQEHFWASCLLTS